MQANGARVAFAVLSGTAVVAALAGCTTTASMSPAALKQLAAAQATPMPAASQPAQNPAPIATAPTTADPSSTAPSTAKSTATSSADSDSDSGSSSKSTTAPTTAPAPTSSPPRSHKPTPKPTSKSSGYENGSYSATGSYESPGGEEKLQVDLTLSSGIVTTLSVTSLHVDQTAAGYEARFEGGIGAIVVGKNIADADVGTVAGSSLTALGFNQAIGKIKADAKN